MALRWRLGLWWLLRGAFCICLLAVSWLSLAPQVPLPYSFPLSDKLGHLLAYTALGFTGTALVSSVAKLALSISVAAFGVAMEAAQGHIAGRTADLGDIAANFLGLLIGLLVTFAFERRLNRRLMRPAASDSSSPSRLGVGNVKSGRY